MNYSDITIGIVTFKSESVIFDCLKSVKKIKKIIIFDNSNDISLKTKIKRKYPKIKFILSKKNLGFGGGNNKILNLVKTKFFFLLSPDTILHKNCETELLKKINKLNSFSVLAPFAKENNYGFFDQENKNSKNLFFEVDYVKGFSMLFDSKKLKKYKGFDENIFLYLEEIDLCKRLRENNEKIFIYKKARIKHLGASSSNIGFEYEKCRNWHWMWSKVYFDKKHKGILITLLKYLLEILNIFIKLIFYLFVFNKKKIILSSLRLSGILNCLVGNSSWYRPKI